MVIAQFCDYDKHYWIAHIKWVNDMAYKLCLSKTTIWKDVTWGKTLLKNVIQFVEKILLNTWKKMLLKPKSITDCRKRSRNLNNESIRHRYFELIFNTVTIFKKTGINLSHALPGQYNKAIEIKVIFISWPFHNGHSNSPEVISHYRFDLHFPDVCVIQHFSHTSWPLVCFLKKKNLFRFLPIFNWIISFFVLSYKSF